MPSATVNMHDAKTNLSRLVERIESGADSEIVLARNGRPVARLVPLAPKTAKRRLGLAKGAFVVPELDAFQALDAEIAETFFGDSVAGRGD
ncbi:MAG: type II toxin-antitoxin system Phd/YefM family antitoxin [Beijerinckiaceae bacterium]